MPYMPGLRGGLRKIDVLFTDAEDTTLPNDGSTSQDWNWTGRSFGPASADRYLVLASRSAADVVTVGGVSFTVVPSTAGQIWLGPVPSGTSGNIFVHITNPNLGTMSFGLWAITGPLNTTVFDTQTVSTVGSSNPLSIDVAAGGIVIAHSIPITGAGVQTCTWSGLTENFDLPRNHPTVFFGHSGASGEFTTPQTVTGSTNWTNAGNVSLTAASFAPL